MTGVLEIWQKSPSPDHKVMMKRPLTEQEALQRSFEKPKRDGVIELPMKKGFYYVVNPEGMVIDCARIYSFLHEDNIY